MEHELDFDAILDVYNELDNWSRIDRYAATPTFIGAEIQQALDHADTIYATIQKVIGP